MPPECCIKYTLVSFVYHNITILTSNFNIKTIIKQGGFIQCYYGCFYYKTKTDVSPKF